MSQWSRFVSWLTTPVLAPSVVTPRPTFDIDAGSIPAEIFGLETYQSPISPQPRVSRREAIQVPAVKRGRDLIAGTIGTVPFRLVDTENVTHPSNLLDQPERDRARSVTMTRTVEDMVFEGKCWWWITEFDWRPFPTKIAKLDPGVVPDRNGHIHITLPGGRKVDIPPSALILFESPSDAVLSAGARAIRTWLKLAGAVDKYADEPTPSGYFTPRPEADPDDVDVKVFLNDWAEARRARATAYVPAVVDYNTVQWNPEQLQLIEGRRQAVVEIAEVLGVDPEDLGVSTTSRTYQNGQQRKLDRINDTLGMYVSAIQERLSMPDVTPRGFRVLADFNGFLRADDKTRYEAYQIGVNLGIFDRDAIAEREGLPQPTSPMPNVSQGAQGANVSRGTSELAASNFDADDPHTFGFFVDPARNTFQVDTQSRTITGLAVPYGVSAVRNGRRWQFSQGSLVWGEVSRVKLLIQHDRSQAVGRALELWDRDDGLFCRFKIARTPEGDHALALAEDGVYDGLSIGLNNDAQFSLSGGIHHSQPGNVLAEISLTPSPAFDDARVSAVVAEADNERTTMECQLCHSHDHTAENCPRLANQFDQAALLDAIGARFNLPPAADPAGTPGRETVTPGGPLGLGEVEVNEPAPYRFDRSGSLLRGSHDFANDLRDAQRGDHGAHERALGFLQEHVFSAPIAGLPNGPLGAAAVAPDGHQFAAVSIADVATLNPNIQRPDLYVDQRTFVFPLWEAIRKGTLDEITPIVVPKYSSHSALVAAHVQDTEPAEGTFVATSETVTPGAVSGKVRITREVWDQGGPAASALIWQKMVYEYNKALEAIAVTELDAESPGGTITLTLAGAGNVLSADLAAAFADLQFAPGGFSFSVMATQQDLYKRLATAVDTTNRPLFPILGPTNANGQVSPRFSRMNVHGVDFFPSISLAAGGQTVAVNSYLLDPAAVYAVASVPQRLEFAFQVRSVELAIWGYRVVEVIDNPGTRRIVWDPA